MSNKRLDKIIKEYLAGLDSKEGKQVFDHWYNHQISDDSPLENLSTDEKKLMGDELYLRIKSATLTAPSLALHSEKSAYLFWGQVSRKAATIGLSVLLVFATVVLIYSLLPTTHTFQAAFEEIKHVSLPDGSQVTLNANSSIRFEDSWNDKEDREVWLEGEAFFSVIHTANDLKFTVHTDRLDVEVLGTTFNVNNRHGKTEVVLHSGKVKLALEGDNLEDEIVMQPGELIAYSSNKSELLKKNVNPEEYSYWQKQQLMLNNTSLGEIAGALEDFYGVEVIFENKELRDVKLSATETLSLKEKDLILEAISGIYGVSVRQNGQQIIFNMPK